MRGIAECWAPSHLGTRSMSSWDLRLRTCLLPVSTSWMASAPRLWTGRSPSSVHCRVYPSLAACWLRGFAQVTYLLRVAIRLLILETFIEHLPCGSYVLAGDTVDSSHGKPCQWTPGQGQLIPRRARQSGLEVGTDSSGQHKRGGGDGLIEVTSTKVLK